MCIIKYLQVYVAMQHKLIKALMNVYVCNPPIFEDVPKHGLLPIDDELWEFQKHGAGVSFTEVTTQKVIDAHIELTSLPEGFDAWRLVQYFESIQVNIVNYESKSFGVTDERGVNALLEVLHGDGLLTNPKQKIYCLQN